MIKKKVAKPGFLVLDYVSNLIKTINKEFSEPFLPKGFVAVEPSEGGIWLRIGRRDVSIGPDGKSWGAGTSLLGEWVISDNKESLRKRIEKPIQKGGKKK